MLVDIEKLVNFFDISKDGIFHVGAHFGQEMVCYDKMNLKNVVMFEPASANFKTLKEKLGSSRAILVNKGLSSKKERAILNVESSNTGMSNSLLKPTGHLQQYPGIVFESKEEVSLITLDDWYKDNENIKCNLMSIDVQGFELEVLMGSTKTLKDIDLIVCEVNRSELYKDCALVTEIDVFLRYQGFRRVMTNWEGRTWGDAVYVKQKYLAKKGLSVPKIKLVDSLFSHSVSVLGFDSSCLLPTSRFDWTRNEEGDVDAIVFTDNTLIESKKISSKKKIAWLLEPQIISQESYEYISKNYSSFDLVVSHDLNFLKSIKNGVYCPLGGTWINPKDWSDNSEKSKSVSIIASSKNFTQGHNLRHLAANILPSEDRFGSGYKKINNKFEALRDYKFSIVVENHRTEGYFSEKFIDCLMSRTIPIYWGSKNVNDFFDSSGIVHVNSIEDIELFLKNTDFDSYYQNRIEAIESNQKKSRKFSSVDELFFSCILGVE